MIDGVMYCLYLECNCVDYDLCMCFWYKDVVSVGKQIIIIVYSDVITGVLFVMIVEFVCFNGNMSGVVGVDVFIDQLIVDVISMDVGKNV